MQLLLAIASTLAAGILVVLLPGACLLATTRIDRVVPPPLVPAAAFALGLVPMAALTAVTLLSGLPIGWVGGGLLVLVLLSWSTLARRALDERRDARFTRARARTRPSDWLVPIRDFLAGSWLRATPTPALVLALAGSMLAGLVGFYAWNDSLYHIAQAQKLLHLDEPSFSNTLQFRDGSAHPGYLLPAWHETLALVAFVARVDVVTAAWILPALTLPIMLLAVGGLGWAVTRSRAATAPAAAALLLLVVATLPHSDAITNSMQPGVLALGILAPLVMAMVLTSLWQPRVPARDAEEPSPVVASRAALVLALVATAALGMLHVSYLWVLGMGLLGYALTWALRGPWPRPVVRRHLVVGGSVALVAALVIALLYPGLSGLEGLGRDAAAELAYNDSAQYEGENAANLDLLLKGDPEGRFHLRNDYLVQPGGLALLGLVGAVLALLAPRWPGGWYLSGASLLVLLIAQSDRIFPAFATLVTLDQARRIERVLPVSVGLAVLALAVAATAVALWRRGGAMRLAGASLALGAAAAGAVVVDAVPPLAGYGGERIIHPRVLLAILLVLAAGTVAYGAGLVLRLVPGRRRRSGRGPSRLGASWTWPTGLLDGPVAPIALALLLASSAPAWERLGSVARPERLEQVPVDMRGAELRLFSDNVARELRELPVGATVLADPRSRNPYTAMAIAPVYVVASVPRHTALTPRNRVPERFERAVSFFVDGELGDAERRRLLLEERVDAVLVHPAAARDARTWLEEQPGVRVAATGRNQRLYLVDRARLRAD